MTDIVSAGDLLRFALALVFVVGLIGLLALLLKRYGSGLAFAGRQGGVRRLSVREMLPIDARHRLVLVRRDNKEHLLLLGPQGSMVVETGVDAPPEALRQQGGEPASQGGRNSVPGRNAGGKLRFQNLVASMTAKTQNKTEKEPDKG